MTTRNTSSSKSVSSTPVRSAIEKAGNYSIAGISLPEIAVLGAAGYVLWKNREKIETFLTDNGIEVPAILSGDMSNLVQTGANLLANKNNSSSTSSRTRHDA